MSTLSDLIAIQRQFDTEHAIQPADSRDLQSREIDRVEFELIAILGELGEFANTVKQLRRLDRSIADARGDLQGELADVFIYLLRIADALSVDLEAAFLERVERNKAKFRERRRPPRSP